MAKIQLKRGDKANLPTLSEAELAFCKDTKELYIGTSTGNYLVNQGYDDVELSGNIIKFKNNGNVVKSLDLSILSGGGTTVEIVDSLTSNDGNKALSAKQGKILNDTKVDKVEGKQLSTNDFTTEEKNKLANLQNSDVDKSYVDNELAKKSNLHEHPYKPSSYTPTWEEVTDKPTIPSKTSELTNDSNFATETFVTNKITALNGSIGDLSKLNTNNKNNLVDVINELLALINSNLTPPHVSVKSVTLNKSNLTITVGDTATLLATVLPSDASNKSVSWSSDNNSVLSVNNGLVTAESVGNATITVTTADGNKTASCSVKVENVSTDGFDIRYLRLDRNENQLIIPTNICEVDTANIGEHNDVVHPSALYFKNGWNGYKYWMAITPYPKTQSAFENPCMMVSNDGDNWKTIGNVPIYPIMNGAAHNSDPHIFMDGDTMIYINRGATYNNSCMIEYFTSTNGVDWTERTKIIDAGEHNYLSPSVCKYNNKYYMFVYDDSLTDIDDNKQRITVLESDSINGQWTKINTILCSNISSIWHLEVKIIDGDFVGLIMSGSAIGGNLHLIKFKTPMDLTPSDYIVSPIVIPNGKANIEAVLYKSTMVKVDNKLELFINSKGKGTLDAFCHWTLNRGFLTNANIVDSDNGFSVEKVINNSEFVNINIGGSHKGFNATHYNYEVEFSVRDEINSHIALSTWKNGTTDFMYLGLFENEAYFAYIKSGVIRKKHNIIFKITKNSIFKFIKIDGVCSLYIDNRLVGSINEHDFDDLKPNYYKNFFGVCSANIVGNSTPGNIDDITYCKLKLRPFEAIDLSLANEELQSEKNNFAQNPSQYHVYDSFKRSNGVLVKSENGVTYSTDTTMPSIDNNMCKVTNGGHKALVDIQSNNYTIYSDLRPTMNGHLIYLKYVDSNNFISCSFGNNRIGVVSKISGSESRVDYNIFNENNEKYIIKADVRNNILSLKCNNQLIIEDLDISNVESTKIGFGAWLALCNYDSFIVKK